MSSSHLVSRRRLLSGTAAGMLAAGIGAANARPRATQAYSWDETYDIIIVGSGFGGLAAAYAAHKDGVKKILILEKMVSYGGNSAICGGLMCMPQTELQKSKGITDSPQLMAKDMIKAGRGFNHPDLARTLSEQAHTVYPMLMECGVKLMDKVIRLGGHSAPRAHIPTNASGGGVVVPMHNWLLKEGIEFRNRTCVEEIVRDGSEVLGVNVRKDYDWRTDTDKGMESLRARLGVIVASGGWGQDHDFIKATMPAYQNLECTSQPGADATMIKAMLSIGALPVMLDVYQLGPWASPDEKGAGPGSFFADYSFAEGIALDPKTCKRFMNELADRRTRADAELAVLAKGTREHPNYPFTFCSQATADRAEGFKAAYREGTVRRSNSVEELAKLQGVDPKALQAAIDDWNDIVAGKKADPFKKPLDVKTKLEPPFYSLRLSPKLHYCMGGVSITTKAEVVDFRTLKPIPGLYAAGEVTGGTHGMDRLGGCSSVDGLVFGQIAGHSAAGRRSAS
ncbi:MAG: Flavocytochrome c [Burkholderia sp.]|jgi:fumarate reductase flavoprotein subunit